MNGCIYFDNAATTWPKPECVYEALDTANRNYAANAGRGLYRISKQASDIIEDARTMMARLLGCSSPRQFVFAPSATIALNEIIYGVRWNEHSVAYVSPYDHNAAIRPLRIACERYGAQIVVMPCVPDGSIDLERLSTMFAQKAPNYVFVSHVSNVTGYILPVQEIAALAHRYDAMVTVDAAQSAGIFPIDLSVMGADFIVLAGHKGLYASFGIGGFAGKDLSRLTPVIAGGTGSDSLNINMPSEHPTRFEPASPNIVAIAGLLEALRWRNQMGADAITRHEQEMTNALVDGLIDNKRLRLYLPGDRSQHIGVVSFNHRGFFSDELGSILDHDYNIAVRAGYHCAPFVHDMIGSIAKRGTVRAAVSWFTTREDIRALIAALEEI